MRWVVPFLTILATPAALSNTSWLTSSVEIARAGACRDTQQLSEYSRLLSSGSERQADFGTEYQLALIEYFRLALSEPGSDAWDDHYDSALERLEFIVETYPDNAEGHALLSGVFGQKASRGGFAAMRAGPKSGRAAEEALALDPDNPRAQYFAALGDLNKPKMFGGDAERSLQQLQHIAAHFRSGEAQGWGLPQVLAWIGVAHSRLDQTDQARASFEQALKQTPCYAWVRDVLVPGL